MKWIGCTYHQHAETMREILNHAIVHTTSRYEYQPYSMEKMQEWFEVKTAGNYPVVGLQSDSGELLGFASYGTFRAAAAYHYTVEHSVYVHPEQQGKGYGKLLLQRIIAEAVAQDYHSLIGGIDAANAASIALHEKQGFRHVGTVQQAGFKFGRWLDLAFYQLILPTPHQPRETK